MKKRFIIALSFALFIVAGIIGYKVFNKRESIVPRQMAIYIPNETGTSYVRSNYKTIAEAIAAGYKLNETASSNSCTNGGTITYNESTQSMSITVGSATSCILYFDLPTLYYQILSKAGSNLATGDKIAIGDENFWVISNTNGTIRALAEYNINVGSNKNPSVTEGLQDESIKGWVSGGTKYGNVAFDSSSSTYSGSEYEGYINDYIDLLVSTYGLNVNDISGDAITKTELETLGCDSSSKTCSGSSYPWVYTTSYWSGSAFYSSSVWGVRPDGLFGDYTCNGDNNNGVRPVVILSESIFQENLVFYSRQRSIASQMFPEENLGSFDTYSNGDVFIKTIAQRGKVKHNACLKYNDREFCLGPNYWVSEDSDGSLTEAKLKNAMENDLGTTVDDCSYGSSYAMCWFDDGSYCTAYSSADSQVEECVNQEGYGAYLFSDGHAAVD